MIKDTVCNEKVLKKLVDSLISTSDAKRAMN